MHVAVSGASGLIGTALCESLRRSGHEVSRLVRRVGNGPGEIFWDPTRGTLDPSALEGTDAVVNLSGAPIGAHRWTDAYKLELLDSRVASTSLLATTLAQLDRKPAVLLSASAVGIYGEQNDRVLTESSAAGRGGLADICQQWEAATAAASEAGARVAHLRTGVVLARGGGALGKMLPLFRLGLGGKMGHGRAYWSWISLADEISAIEFLLHHPLSGAVNLTAPAPVTNAEFTQALGRALRRPTRLPVPSFGPKLLLGAELADALLFTSARVMPQALLDAGYQFHHPDLASALQAVLHSPAAVGN